jgi:choline dehydrogenase
LEGRKAVGVRFRQNGELRELRAAREVILSAGAIGSPQILQLFGIGPAPYLQSLGLDVVLDQPGIGANLQDHLQIRCAYKVLGRHDAEHPFGQPLGQGADRRRIRAVAKRPDVDGAVAAGRLSQNLDQTSPRPIWNTTCSRCRSTRSARGFTRSTPSRRASATCARKAAGTCGSPRPTRGTHPEIRPNYLSTARDRRVAPPRSA